jgi:hypothetical protein
MGSDSSVTNDPFVELGFTPLYVGLLSVLGSVDGMYVTSHEMCAPTEI